MKILQKKCCKKSVRGDFHFQTERKLAIFRKLIDFLCDQKNPPRLSLQLNVPEESLHQFSQEGIPITLYK